MPRLTGIFHADPHQGNIMVSGGRVHWIDFGMIGEITEADITALENIVVGLLKSDTDLMADGVLSIGLNTGGCKLCETQIRPILPNGIPLIAVFVLMVGGSMLIFALKRIFRKKKK